MQTLHRWWFFAACLSFSACGGSLVPSADDPALLELRVAIAEPELVEEPLRFTILGPRFNHSGTLDVIPSPLIIAELNDIPAGQGYTLSLVSEGPTANCHGGTTFDLIDGKKAIVPVALSCTKFGSSTQVPDRAHDADAGRSVFVGAINECPEITSVALIPSRAPVGKPIHLVVSASDADHAPKELSITWSASSGTFADPHQAATEFMCEKPGTANLVVTASDGDAPCDAFAKVDVVCESACTCADADGGG